MLGARSGAPPASDVADHRAASLRDHAVAEKVALEAVARQRRELKPSFAEKGVNLTYMPFVVRASRSTNAPGFPI